MEPNTSAGLQETPLPKFIFIVLSLSSIPLIGNPNIEHNRHYIRPFSAFGIYWAVFGLIDHVDGLFYIYSHQNTTIAIYQTEKRSFLSTYL